MPVRLGQLGASLGVWDGNGPWAAHCGSQANAPLQTADASVPDHWLCYGSALCYAYGLYRVDKMKEFRCITFNEQDVGTAVIERRRSMREALPVGTVQSIKYDTKDKNNIIATMSIVDDYGRGSELAIYHDELAASLVRYCLDHRIILPTDSVRWMEHIGKSDVAILMDVLPPTKKKAKGRSG